jgi:hypothetical protein
MDQLYGRQGNPGRHGTPERWRRLQQSGESCGLQSAGGLAGGDERDKSFYYKIL